jgi:hypothetical protein
MHPGISTPLPPTVMNVHGYSTPTAQSPKEAAARNSQPLRQKERAHR